MAGPYILLAAASLASPAPPKQPVFRPTSSVSAHATARIEIISGVRFGQNHRDVPASASLRPAQLTDADGQVRPAELLEFQ
jgi:hypothetical protein